MNYIVSHDAYLSKEIIHRRRRSWFLKSNDTYQKTFWTTEVASFLMDSSGDC